MLLSMLIKRFAGFAVYTTITIYDGKQQWAKCTCERSRAMLIYTYVYLLCAHLKLISGGGGGGGAHNTHTHNARAFEIISPAGDERRICWRVL